MNRVNYQNLRFSVEAAILDGINDSTTSTTDLTNNLMRLFLGFSAQEEVNALKSKREFITFRRQPNVTVPGWAYHPTGRK